MGRVVRTIYLSSQFGTDELLDELTDDELSAELVKRGTSNGAKAAVHDAIAQIRRGEHSNAITTLEREFLPKWQSTEACRADYNKATGAPGAINWVQV